MFFLRVTPSELSTRSQQNVLYNSPSLSFPWHSRTNQPWDSLGPLKICLLCFSWLSATLCGALALQLGSLARQKAAEGRGRPRKAAEGRRRPQKASWPLGGPSKMSSEHWGQGHGLPCVAVPLHYAWAPRPVWWFSTHSRPELIFQVGFHEAVSNAFLKFGYITSTAFPSSANFLIPSKMQSGLSGKAYSL